MKKGILISVIIIALTVIIIILIDRAYRERQDPNEITLYGNVDVRQVDIGFRVSGLVTQLLFEEGDQVPKGTLMCTLDDTPYDSQLEQAIAAAESVRANLDNAEILLRRRQDLIGIGAVSQEDLDNAQAHRDQLAADLMQAEAAIQVAKDKLAYTQAYAPTDGIILTRIREPGTVVNPADPVFTLSVSSPVWIRAFVNEPNLGRVYYGMPAEVYTDMGRSYSGSIGFISPVAEFTPKTVETTQLRTDLVYRLRIYVDNPNHELVQGMPVTVKLINPACRKVNKCCKESNRS
ncbi:MAG TPA: efflux RND transporter periplasmic adaptor subunit [Rhabdochlamydiaceae bacterium]|jgi:HlyD family secretion protein|nr:efflux RND transporter periplasmic adaptor subunit [Rhabdochlamydiaceae bacterium]